MVKRKLYGEVDKSSEDQKFIIGRDYAQPVKNLEVCTL